MPVYPIPTDWAGDEWACIIIEWPNSVEWLGILRGLITTPVRGRFWDATTGSILDAQAIGLEIEERNPVSSCDEIVAQLMAIAAAVESLDVSQDLQVAIQTNIQNNINVVATAIADSLALQSVDLVAASVSSASASANAFAWSQSMAQSLTAVTIINNTEGQFRPIEVGVDPPPTAAEATPTGITSVLDDTSPTEICKRVYWLVRNAKEFFNYAQGVRFAIADTVLGALALVADGLWVASLTADPLSKRFLIPAAVILNFAHGMQTAFNEGLDPLMLLDDWIDNNYQEIVCFLAMKVEAVQSTEELRDYVVGNAISWGLTPTVANLAVIMFNFSSLAAFYYVSPLLDPAPAIPASEPPNICTVCGV